MISSSWANDEGQGQVKKSASLLSSPASEAILSAPRRQRRLEDSLGDIFHLDVGMSYSSD
jgi:hypothetical protein